MQSIDGRPVFIIVSKSNPLGQYTRLVTAKAPSAQVVELDRTHSGATLLKQDAQMYDDAVVGFFTRVEGFAPPQAVGPAPPPQPQPAPPPAAPETTS